MTRAGTTERQQQAGPHVVRASARADRPLPDADVGRILLLRPAGAAGLLHDQASGLSQAKSSAIYGAYGAAAFFSPFIGGLIADRWLGRTKRDHRRNVDDVRPFRDGFEALLFPALALVALGNGLFIPPLAIQVGSLYARRRSAQGPCLQRLLHGHQSRRRCWRRWCAEPLASFTAGTGGLRRPESAWPSGSSSICQLLQVTLPPELKRNAMARRRSAARRSMRAMSRPCCCMVAMIVAVPRRLRTERQRHRAVGRRPDRPLDRSVWFRPTIPATWFQSINPLLIILGTPVLIRAWRSAEREGNRSATCSAGWRRLPDCRLRCW